MVIIEDTRQQKGKHEIKHDWFATNGVELLRCKLPFGDYAPPPKVAIDTKKDMEEIAGNICGSKKEHMRFKREVIAARDAGCKLYILVENENGISSIDQVHEWINPDVVFRPDCVQGSRLEKAMKTMQERYGCVFLFCKHEATGRIIKEIIEREDGERNTSSGN